MIVADGLQKHFRAADGSLVKAVDNVSFTVGAGEMVGLLGANGVGKTTTMRLLATLLAPTAGTASIGACDITADPLGVRRQLGYLSATTGVPERLTPREVLVSFGRLHGLDEGRIEARVDPLVATLGLTDCINRPCGRLSTGQRQRVSLGRALVHDPQTLVLDEPTSGLDVIGARDLLDLLEGLRDEGRLTSLEQVMVTHYHDDHTDALPVLVQEFGARVHACGSLVDLVERPGDYRLPCLTRNPTPVTAPHQHGDSWRWKEYRMTILDFPGQTLHHNALLVEQDDGWAALFAGDSFTPSGIDDYCLQNRNFVREGHGYLRCLDLLETLPSGCWVLNQHVEPAFRFSPAQVAQMRDTLRRRIPLMRELLPFDDPNFGLDETWAAMHPVWNVARPGDGTRLALRITNHSSQSQTFDAQIRAPAGYVISAPASVRVPPHTDGWLPLTVQVPRDATPGLVLITADLSWGTTALREWTEAVLEVSDSTRR